MGFFYVARTIFSQSDEATRFCFLGPPDFDELTTLTTMTFQVWLACNEHNHPHFPHDRFWWSVLIDPPDDTTSGTLYKFVQVEDTLEWMSEREEVTRDFETRRDDYPAFNFICTVENLNVGVFDQIWDSTIQLLGRDSNIQGAVRMALQTAVNRNILPRSAIETLNNDVPTALSNIETSTNR